MQIVLPSWQTKTLLPPRPHGNEPHSGKVVVVVLEILVVVVVVVVGVVVVVV